MAEEKAVSADQQKKVLAEVLWLTYFNEHLYENNMITESQRNQLKVKIDSRKASTYGVVQKRHLEQ